MSNQRFVNGSTLLGIALILLGMGSFLPGGSWQSALLLVASFVYIFFSYKAFMDNK